MTENPSPGWQRLEIGAIDAWRDHYGGFRPTTSRDGRRVLDHELTMQYIGMTANSLEPGEQAGYWHTHSRVEELYVFLTGRGEMGLTRVAHGEEVPGEGRDEDRGEVVAVGPGTVIRVGQHVWRTWRAVPDSPERLSWLCIRAGGAELPHFPDDAERDDDRAMPW